MKKTIVFKVENVLVKEFDEKRMDEMNGRKILKGMLGEELFEKEFVKVENRGKRKVMSFIEMIGKMEELERRFEEDGDLMKKYWMRDVRKRIEEWDKRKEKRLEDMKKKYLEEGFEKRVIGVRNELKDLENICGRIGGRMVFISDKRKSRVERLLYNNGLRVFEVREDLEFIKKEEEKDVIVFDNAGMLMDIWKEVGLRRG